jgi:hypothetical protein
MMPPPSRVPCRAFPCPYGLDRLLPTPPVARSLPLPLWGRLGEMMAEGRGPKKMAPYAGAKFCFDMGSPDEGAGAA